MCNSSSRQATLFYRPHPFLQSVCTTSHRDIQYIFIYSKIKIITNTNKTIVRKVILVHVKYLLHGHCLIFVKIQTKFLEPISLVLKRSSQCFGEITMFRCKLDFSLEHILKYIYFITLCPLFQQLKN